MLKLWILLMTAVVSLSQIDASKYDTSKTFSLPKGLSPENYKLFLDVVFDQPEAPREKFTFDGTVDILVNVKIPTKNVVLHTRNLTTTCSVFKEDGTPLEPDGPVRAESATEWLFVPLKEEMQKDTKYIVKCEFNGTLDHKDWKGFYLSTYKEGEETKYLGTTQFESSGARRAFPCFDEPGFKATFDVTIKAPSKYNTIISNTEVLKQDKKDRTVTFKPTPVMSTYLLAFIVSDFKSYTTKKAKSPKMTVYSRESLIEFAPQSFEFGRASIQAMEEYLGMTYQLPKLDQIGIPDFKSGAMENWGLVTYREAQFLWNPQEATTLQLNKIYCTITHEFAHQWFGNLVTPRWWKYIWLNEGFARYLQYMVTDDAVAKLTGSFKQQPWRTVEQFIVARHSAFKDDGLNSTRPMTTHAENPEEVNDLFDTIAYAKSGSVLYMLEHILTTPVWKSGLKSYLTQFGYQYVEPKDLWDHLQTAYNVKHLESPESVTNLGHYSIQDIGNSWSLETGYPVVSVTKVKGKVTLEQRRFQTDFKNPSLSKWIIPITYALGSTLDQDIKNTKPQFILGRGSGVVKVPDSDDFILINNLQTGYYRVNYDKENWMKLIENKILSQVPKVTAAQLIDDSLNLARGGYLSYSIALPLLRLLNDVTDYIPWEAAVTSLKFLDTQLRNTATENHYKEFQKEILSKVYKEIVHSYKVEAEDDHSLKLNRLNVLKRSCDFGVADCLLLAPRVLRTEYLSNPRDQPMLPDVQTSLYCGGARGGDDEIYRNMVERYTILKSSSEKKQLALALGCFENGEILNKVLEDTLNKDTKLKDDITSVYVGLIEGSTNSLTKVLSYLEKHYEHIETVLGEENMKTVISTFGNYISTQSHLDKLNKLEPKLKGDVLSSFKSVSKKIKKSITWNKEHLPEIEDWLIANYNNASGLIANLGLLVLGIFTTLFLRN